MPHGAPLAVGIITLGCPKNEVDSDRMRAALAASAYRVADELDEADVVVLNTCAFIQEATEESIETILELASSWAPAREGRRLIVAGCLPSRYGDELAAELPEVDAFVPVADESGLLRTIERLTGVPASARPVPPTARTSMGPSAYLMIADGCHRRCAYCTIPLIRGPYRSRPLDELVAEARSLVEQGAKEIVLVGQDTTSYGRDLADGSDLALLIERLAAIEGLAWLRLMYAQPDGISDRLLAVMADHGNVCRYVDMPLQHVSRSVLARMRRRGDADRYARLIERIRSRLPGVVLRTTVIAGFPGETRADARALERFLEAVEFDYVGVFAFSPEEGTPAAAMADQVPARTRRARAQRLRDLSDRIGERRAASHVGSVLEVLVEGTDPDDGSVIGRWRGQAPEVDGIVRLDRGEPGELLRVRIVDAVGYDLEGEVT